MLLCFIICFTYMLMKESVKMFICAYMRPRHAHAERHMRDTLPKSHIHMLLVTLCAHMLQLRYAAAMRARRSAASCRYAAMLCCCCHALRIMHYMPCHTSAAYYAACCCFAMSAGSRQRKRYARIEARYRLVVARRRWHYEVVAV